MDYISHDFHYILPIENDAEADFSLFQGFSFAIFPIIDFIDTILRSPANLIELSVNREKAISLRMSSASGYKILPIEKRYLSQMEFDWHTPFLCIFSNEHTISEVNSFIHKLDQPVLHISDIQSANTVLNSDVDRNVFWDYFLLVKEFLEKNAPEKALFFINMYSKKFVFWEKKIPSFKTKLHLVTVPNLMALNSFYYKVEDNEDFVAAVSNKYYIDEIKQIAEYILNERSRIAKSGTPLLHPPGCTLILTTQSIYLHLYKKKINLKDFRTDNIEEVRRFSKSLKLIQRQKDYFIKFDPKQDNEALMRSPAFQTAMSIRSDETRAYTAAVSIYSCNNFAPALRLPPILNSIRVDLQKIGECSRGRKQKINRKINNLFVNIANKLSSSVPPEFMQLIDSAFNYIKVIADAPLEWLPVRKLPLMIRFDVSRVPVTPGNLSLNTSCQGKALVVTQKEFEEILIIRSFKTDDPIRNELKQSLEVISKDYDFGSLIRAFNNDPEKRKIFQKINESKGNLKHFKIQIRWIDVSNKDELINALNSYHGPLMIFDGHGLHEKRKDFGSLVIGNEFVDIWTLRKIARIPPIVLLSACDTHPIDASHASTANGFLHAGAYTVLGTLLPVDAKISGLFIARLILRMELFIPIAIESFGGSIRWTSIISGLQRMIYITELLHNMYDRQFINITDDQYLRLTSKSNDYINRFDPHWFERIISEIENETGISNAEIYEFLSSWHQLPDCLKYIQLGNPENIIIVSDKVANKLDNGINIENNST
jgi:hypothetical protein